MNLGSQRVLIFGDSLTHRGARSSPDARVVTEDTDRTSTPGDMLASYLLDMGAGAARINGRVSRSAYNFFTVEDGAAILQEEVAWEPDTVFVFLGTNDLGLDPKKDAAAFKVIKETFESAGAKVYAIGPPSFAAKTATEQSKTVMKTLNSVFGSKNVIDLRPLTKDLTEKGRADDGVHFKADGAKLVAYRLATAIAAHDNPSALRLMGGPVALGLVAGVVVGLTLARRRTVHALE